MPRFELLFLAASLAAAQPALRAKLNILTIADGSVKTIYQQDSVLEAPNWSPDGKQILFNSDGHLYTIAINGGAPRMINLSGIAKCNNDKGFSPDGKLIAFSSSAQASGSQVYVVSAEGGQPQRIVDETPSYFHAFSPDNRFLAFVSKRNGNFDLFRVPVHGGPQEQLTTNTGYDDGPDYSPDGKWIYFNSNRSGKWAVWRMPASGAGPDDSKAQQVTFDDVEDWFPHCSPDGKWMVFVTFPKGTETHNDRMPGVELHLARLPGKTIQRSKNKVLLTFYGGQGTINVNSWAPDSKQFAFVSFEPINQ